MFFPTGQMSRITILDKDYHSFRQWSVTMALLLNDRRHVWPGRIPGILFLARKIDVRFHSDQLPLLSGCYGGTFLSRLLRN